MSKTTLLNRREAVKMAAAGALLAASGSCIVVVQQAFGDDVQAEEEPEKKGDVGAPVAVNGQVGFLVKPKNCLNCQACVEACRKFNKIPDEEPTWRRVTKYERDGEAPLFVSTSCMHCADPACATVCPAGAITKGEAGIVSVNPDRCIGCKYCYQACPFSVPQYNSQSMVKCDCCLGNGVKPGETPHCAEACNFGALHFGIVADLLEKCPDAVVVDASTAPSLYLA